MSLNRDSLPKAGKSVADFAKRVFKKKEQPQEIDPATAIALMLLLFIVLPLVIGSKITTKKKR